MIVLIEGPFDARVPGGGANDWAYLNMYELCLYDTEQHRYIWFGRKMDVSVAFREFQRLAVERGFTDWDEAIMPPPPTINFTFDLQGEQVDPGPLPAPFDNITDDDEPF